MAEAVSIPLPPDHPFTLLQGKPFMLSPVYTLHQTHLEETVGLFHGSKTIHPTLTTFNPNPTDTSHIYDETFCDTSWDSEFSTWLRGALRF
ncbi:hypothetical protein HAV15_009182 [Penicillium sp. str. |nr:hypothetical protein HAV15_009182 [Penicillium sp. str. \